MEKQIQYQNLIFYALCEYFRLESEVIGFTFFLFGVIFTIMSLNLKVFFWVSSEKYPIF